jgi:hypothetical protein
LIELVLQGEIITPLITKASNKTNFYFKGCNFRILNPRRRFINKINASTPMYAYSYRGYLGLLEVRYRCKTKEKAMTKLKELVKIQALGLYLSEGMGRILWLKGKFKKLTKVKLFSRWKQKVKIRKNLPYKLSKEAQKLIYLALLHDFFNTVNHRSKIYVEPQIEDIELVELLREHHSETQDELLLLVQKYDRWSASLTRPNYKSPRQDRYNWQSKKKVEFERLATQIVKASKKGVWTFYRFIYENTDLDQLNESLEHGHTSLKRHLLIMVNLIVLDLMNGNIRFSAPQKAI